MTDEFITVERRKKQTLPKYPDIITDEEIYDPISKTYHIGNNWCNSNPDNIIIIFEDNKFCSKKSYLTLSSITMLYNRKRYFNLELIGIIDSGFIDESILNYKFLKILVLQKTDLFITMRKFPIETSLSMAGTELIQYTSSSSVINNYLRGGFTLDKDKYYLKQIINNVDHKFSTAKTSLSRIIYRGVNTDTPEEFIGLNITYISTTTDINISALFANKKGCIFEIHVDDDVPYIDVSENSPFKTEKEILLPREIVLTRENEMIFRYKNIPVYIIRASLLFPNQIDQNLIFEGYICNFTSYII